MEIPERPNAADYERPPRELQRYVPDHAATLTKDKKDKQDKKSGQNKKNGKND